MADLSLSIPFYNEELKQELINDIRQSTNQFDVKIYINGEAWA